MELQWNKRPCAYIKTQFRQVQPQEQTQELRLTEEMPDIGRVLCAWGQPVVRSKEWRMDAVMVTGGVNASVAYMPEDGSGIKVMETWIPFQSKWNLQQTSREGTIRVKCLLRELDARLISARKLMLRANVAVFAEGLESSEVDVFSPDELPVGVEVLTNIYPAMIPKEAGEKQFFIEEELHVPDASQWISFTAAPEITEHNLVGSRIVIRGVAKLHYVYLNDAGEINSGNQPIPFAQFIDLDGDYDKETLADILLILSTLEHELAPDGVKVQCGIAAQYLVWNRELLEIAEDAYSNQCAVSIQQETVALPMQLDERTETVNFDSEPPRGNVLDVVFRPDFPISYREGDCVHIEIPGNFQYLFLDSDANLQSMVQNAVATLDYPANTGCQLVPYILETDFDEQSARMAVGVQTHVNQELSMISGLAMGEIYPTDQVKPTLILRRMNTDSLWQLAKESGSTMDAIRKANQLTSDPVEGEMLLIPVN